MIPTVPETGDGSRVMRQSAVALVVLAGGLGSACAHAGAPRASAVPVEAHGTLALSRDEAGAEKREASISEVQEAEALQTGDGARESIGERAAIDDVGELRVEEARPSPGLRRAVEETVRSETSDFPVELNDAVLACIELYQGRLRDWFQQAMARGARILPHIREVFASEGLPRDLAYVALVESAFKPAALSRAQARGVWQFMPATGRRFGLQQDWWVDERSDPEKATRAAARYLKNLFGLFGDWNLALAGYNAGEGNVLKAVARFRTDSFWELIRTEGLRRETRNYVPLIHAAILVAKAPDRYGFTPASDRPDGPERVPVRGPLDLRAVGECVGLGETEIRLLNPELRHLTIPPARQYDLKVPLGHGLGVLDCLRALPASRRVPFQWHTVAKGQTLSAIARAHRVRTQDLAAANGLASGQKLAPGTRLIVPTPRHERPPTRATAAQNPTTPRAGDSNRTREGLASR
jgi:membrane-bound lytic murein transglycosylase D